jgi:hypothetical protein
MKGFWLNSFGSDLELMLGSYEADNKFSGSRKRGKFLNHMGDYQFLNMACCIKRVKVMEFWYEKAVSLCISL